MGKFISIAIDGDASTGKSTAGKLLAHDLGFKFFSTGSLYRVLTLKCFESGVDFTNKEQIIDALKDVQLKVEYRNETPFVLVSGEEVDEKLLHNEEISGKVAYVAKYPEVREKVLRVQRNLAKTNNIVIEGRDIGTVVIPNADYKFFLTASPEVRAERRYKQLLEQGDLTANKDKILAGIIARDIQDKTRKVSPSLPAKDAVIIDTSNITLFETVLSLQKCVKNENVTQNFDLQKQQM